MTYLEMCQQVIRDLGLQNTIASVTNQSGMNQKIASWIADADVAIQSLWVDWNFLWDQYTVSTIVGTKEIAAPDNFGTWDRTSIYLDYSTDDSVHLNEVSYLEWRDLYRQGTQTNGEPSLFSIIPTNNIYLEPAPDAVYSFTADYWRVPTRMTVSDSVSPIPVRFQRVILAQAKIYYAEHDEFPTVYELATAEYKDLMNQLESAELPGKFENLRMSNTPGSPLIVVPE